MVGDSFAYAKEGLVGKWMRWFLLLVSAVIFPLLLGYQVRIYRGTAPAPEPGEWVSMFIDGIKLLVVGIIYAIPILILEFFLIGSAIAVKMMNPAALVHAIGAVIVGVIILVIVAIIIGLFVATAYVRFARMNSIGEAFNFGAIAGHIGKIGWGSYILALIVLLIIVGIVEGVLILIPYIGWVLLFIILPFLVIFVSRYITLLYDSAGKE